MGGYNDSDPVTSLDRDQAVIAENVEFHCSSRTDRSTVGMRRAGTSAVTTPITASSEVVFLHKHRPTTDDTAVQLWVISVLSGSPTVRYKNTAWNTVTPNDAINVTGTNKYHIRAQSLHGKLFIAYKSAVNRLHVWDGTNLRRAGLAEPAAPSVANTGSGTYSGTRYFRVRYTVQSGGTTILRSEPSDVTTFAPSGSGASARITKPASISEDETHWEVEASVDNALFYRIATVAVGTTTYDDSTVYATGYSSGTLSEDVGDYDLLHSAKFLVADDDRLLLASSWEDEALSSRVAWTSVKNDPGVGNDERSPIDTDNFVDLNTYEGGEITAVSKSVNGYIFVFKYSHIYQLTRTGLRARAYTAHTLSKSRGAIPGSVVEGFDQNGRPCVYFADPQFGPCRIGEGGIQSCSLDIHRTWETVNLEASVVARSVFYADSSQVTWWVATNSSDTPDLGLTLHINKSRQTDDGIRRGWVKVLGNRGAAISVCMFPDNIEDNAARSRLLRPFIGKTDGTIHMCDSGTTDSGTAFAARIRSGPVLLDPLNMMGIMDAGIVCAAASGVTLVVKAIRNFGEETKSYNVLLTPDGSEDPVIKSMDDFDISEANAVQIEFADEATPSGNWNVYLFSAEPRAETSNAK